MGRLLAMVALGALLLSSAEGCHSNHAAEGRPKVVRAGHRWDPHELDFSRQEEQSIEAHARFAAGVVEELDESPDSALSNYRAAVANDPTNEILTLDVARKLVELRRLEDARVFLERSTQRPEASGLVWGWLGTVLMMQGNPSSAIVANREAIRRMPKNIGGYQNLVQIYLEADQSTNALTVLEEAASQPVNDPGFLIVLADTLGVLAQVKDPALGNLRPRIVALLDRAGAMNPERPEELLRLADLYQLVGESTKALPIYQKLLETSPDLEGLRERLTDIYLRTDNRAKAVEQLKILALRQPSNPLPHYYLGVLALEGKQFEDAVSAFNQALILRPDIQAMYFDLAVAYLGHGRAQDALAVLDRARSRFRPSFQLEFYSGAACSDLKQYNQAIRHYTAAEVIAGATSPDQLTAGFYFQSGMAYERAKQFDDAAVQFEKAIELKPDFAEALNYLGYMWAEQGTNLERAHELIRKAVEIEKDNTAFLDSLAWVLHQLSRDAEALTHQLRAVELNKEPDATLFDHLGDIYQRLGRNEDARRAWQRSQAVESTPEVEKKLRDSSSP